MLKNLLIIFFTSIIFFLIGFFISRSVYYIEIDPNNTFSAGWLAAQNRLEESGFIQDFDKVTVVKRVNGEVIKVSSEDIMLKINPLKPLADPDLDTRIIKIVSKTQIFKVVEKNYVKYEKEIQDFSDKNKDLLIGSEFNLLKPNKYEQVKALKGDIKSGQQLIIDSNENILNKKEIIADKIVIK